MKTLVVQPVDWKLCFVKRILFDFGTVLLGDNIATCSERLVWQTNTRGLSSILCAYSAVKSKDAET